MFNYNIQYIDTIPEHIDKNMAFLTPTQDIYDKTCQLLNIDPIQTARNKWKDSNSYLIFWASWMIGDISCNYFQEDIKHVFQVFDIKLINEDILI